LKSSYRVADSDFSPLADYVFDSLHPIVLTKASLLGQIRDLWTFPLDSVPDTFFSTISWRLEGGRKPDGIAIWFELDLGSGVALSNAPGTAVNVWGQVLLPLSRMEISAAPYEIKTEIGFQPEENIWNWSVFQQDGVERHSTAFNRPINKKDFINRDLPLKLDLNPEGEIVKQLFLSAEKDLTPAQFVDLTIKKSAKAMIYTAPIIISLSARDLQAASSCCTKKKQMR
jgi:hypothetical protein